MSHFSKRGPIPLGFTAIFGVRTPSVCAYGRPRPGDRPMCVSILGALLLWQLLWQPRTGHVNCRSPNVHSANKPPRRSCDKRDFPEPDFWSI